MAERITPAPNAQMLKKTKLYAVVQVEFDEAGVLTFDVRQMRPDMLTGPNSRKFEDMGTFICQERHMSPMIVPLIRNWLKPYLSKFE